MAQENAKDSSNRRTVLLAAVAAVLVLAFALGAWYVTSEGFRGRVRERVIAELERTTGGRVELKSLTWKLSGLEIEVRDLTIHGLEPQGELPFVHVERLYARLRVVSLWSRQLGLQHVTLDRPTIHVIVNPDDTTNVPTPKTKVKSRGNPVQPLFDLAIGRTEVHDGMLVWNQKRLPLDMAVNDLAATLSYQAATHSYDGAVHIGKVETAFQELRPFSSVADIDFSLFADRAQLKSVKLSSGQTRLDASGTLVDFNDPKIELVYKATVDLGQTGSIVRVHELRRGTLELNGQATYSSATFASSGRLLVKDGAYEVDGFHLDSVMGGAEYSVSPERISLPQLYAHAFGGNVRGEVNLRDWLPPGLQHVSRTSSATQKREQTGEARLKLTEVPVGQIASALTSKKLPLSKLNLLGRAQGEVVARWQGSIRNATAEIDMTALPTPSATPNELPVTASMKGNLRFASHTMDIAQFEMTTPATRIEASGTLGSTKADLRVAVSSGRLSEFQPLIDAIRGDEPMPVEIAGSMTFNGTMAGKFAAPSLAGHLELRDFTSVHPALPVQAIEGGTSGPAAVYRIRWDTGSGDVTYSPSQASVSHGVLRRGRAQINVDARATLERGKFTDASPFTARLNVTNAEAAEMLALLDYKYPVSGRLDVNGQFSGTTADPRGKGHISLTDGKAYGQAIKSASADVVFANGEVQLRNTTLMGAMGTVSGEGAYNVRTTAMRFNAHASDFNLAAIEQLKKVPRLQVEGKLSFDAAGSGTTHAPIIDANMRVQRLVVNGEKVGDVVAEAVTKGEDLFITARSSFQNAGLTAEGNVRLRGDMPGNLKLHFNDMSLDPLLKSVLTGRLAGHSIMAGEVEISGPMTQPKLLNVAATITRFEAKAENIQVHNVVPLKFSVKDQVARIDSFRLEGEETHFIEAKGTAELSGEQAVNLRLDGRVNMKLIQTVSPDLASYGTATFGVGVGGTLDHPRMRGQMQIAEGGISYVDLPNGLSNINGTLVFTEDRLQVQKLTARTGGGELQLGGFITFDRTLSFNLTAKGTDIRLRYPPGVSATANADLMLAGTLKNSLLSGDVTVTKFGLNPRFDFASYVASSKQPPPISNQDSPLNGLRLDVHVVSTPQLQVETSLAKVSGDVDIHLRGTGSHPTVLGRVNVIDGDVFFNGTQYHLERGDITFTNPVRIEPVLDMEASAHVRDYDITLGFHGSIDKLSTTYRSDPPLPTADIIALLALGRTREESAGLVQMNNSTPTTTLTESASNALLGQALNATVSSRVQKLFGVSRIKIDPQVGGPENNPNARLTIEQQVSNKITLTYITNLSQSAQQIIQVEYNINRNVSILAVRDQNGVVGFDVRVRQRKR